MFILFWFSGSGFRSVGDIDEDAILVDEGLLDFELLVVDSFLHAGDLLFGFEGVGHLDLFDDGLILWGEVTWRFSEKVASGLRIWRSRWGKRSLSI